MLMLESLLIKLPVFRTEKLLKCGSNTVAFPLNNTKSLRTPILKNNCERRVLEELGRGYFGSTYKARFKGDTVAIKEFIRSKWDKTGEKI